MTAVVEHQSGTEQRKPLMSMKQILLMNVGFFGIQYSFGMQSTAVNPIFVKIGADPGSLPLLNLAGPVCGLLIQPLIGAMSDRTWSPRWGRRKPYFLAGAIGCSVVLFLFPLVSALWMAVLLLWLLDASNNTAMEPYRAFLADKLPDSQLAKGFLTQSFFTGAGVSLANFCLFVFQKFFDKTTSAGIPHWVLMSFWIGAICSIGSILVSVLSTPENPPTAAELEEMRRLKETSNPVGEISSAVRDMPASLHKLGLTYLFQWYALVVYWQFISLSLAKSVFHAGPKDPGYEQGAAMVGLANGTYTLVTMCTAFLLVGMARRYGAKWVHAACLVLASVSMFMLPSVANQWQLLVPMVLLGIAWASCMGVPYIMVVSLVPKERYGVYMGIINMMIVVPMIIQSLTFGWIYDHLLHDNPFNAMRFSGVLFLLAAISMTWIRPPKHQSPIIPLTFRQIMDYRKIMVGSDGTESSLRAVQRAAEVASSSEAELVIACAYNPVPARIEAMLDTIGDTRMGQVRGEEHARAALALSAEHVNTARTRLAPGIVVEGDPAQAIVDAAVTEGADLIVVGNRGLGALLGTVLGTVPGDIAKMAPCDVLIVQTEGEPEGSGPGEETTTTG